VPFFTFELECDYGISGSTPRQTFVMVRSPQEIQEAGRTMTPSVTDTDAEESDPEEGNEVN
jgi:hypothetical protein